MFMTRRLVALTALGLGLALEPCASAHATDRGVATQAEVNASVASPMAQVTVEAAASAGDLGNVGHVVSDLTHGVGTLGFALPAPHSSSGDIVHGLLKDPVGSVQGLVKDPAGALTGTADGILPYGLLDAGKALSH